MEKRLILIVDDNPINRKVLSNILKDNYRFIEAENGQEALDILEERQGEVSAIFLDLTMPVIDGFEFLKIRLQNEGLLSIPVIVQTQKEGVDAEIRCLADGASDFLTKPYNPKLLLHRLENIIKLRENESFITIVQHDTLTGLYNTEGFYTKAEQIINAHPEKAYTILCADINQFKIISQIFDDNVGDEVLKYVGTALKTILGPSSIVARFSADRFHALVDYKIDPLKITNYLHDLLLKAPAANLLHIQIGIYENDILYEHNIKSMCDFSRMAIASIKGQYGKIFAFYNISDYDKVLKDQRMTSQMDRALAEKQFKVYFQPKVEIESGKIIGAEALVRWIHPEDGFMNPGQFIPLFESNGFITKLDKYVWEEVCKIQRDCINAGLSVVPISVNVSRNDIYDDDLVGFFKSLLAKYNLPSYLLHLEITETAYTQGQNKLIPIVKALSESGFYIEMDDFGSGYSSLNMLSELPVDMIKLDMLFMMNRAKNTNRKSVIHLIISIAKELDLDVIAEGVETEEDVRYLKSVGCKLAQGYYYAKPMKFDNFLNILSIGTKIASLKVKHITFSPNGTSLKGGSFLAGKLGTEKLINVTSKFARYKDQKIEEQEMVIISFPTYAGRMPVTFSEYLKDHIELKNTKVVLLATYGNREFEDSLLEAKDIVTSKGGHVIGALAVVAQHSQDGNIATNRPNKEDFKIIDDFARIVINRYPSGDFVPNIPGNRPYRIGIVNSSPKFMPIIDEKCNECNACVTICPTSAMRYNNPEICIHCCACINICPNKAISMKDPRFDKIVDFLEKTCLEPKITQYF
ncbi:MAG: EAL domain-containing protein [Spirochaetaceae bacterium]|nr:EAL domain-containing protein [Spirochaetaceae bacterium]